MDYLLYSVSTSITERREETEKSAFAVVDKIQCCGSECDLPLPTIHIQLRDDIGYFVAKLVADNECQSSFYQGMKLDNKGPVIFMNEIREES